MFILHVFYSATPLVGSRVSLCSQVASFVPELFPSFPKFNGPFLRVTEAIDSMSRELNFYFINKIIVNTCHSLDYTSIVNPKILIDMRRKIVYEYLSTHFINILVVID